MPSSLLRLAAALPLAVPVAVLLIGAGLLASCRSEARRPDVILVTVDTLRADRLTHAGQARDLTPSLDALADGSAVFVEARSSAGWTLPALSTLLTGRRLRTHGATRLDSRLPSALPTLPEILHAHDYDTRAYVSQVLLHPRRGFARGFAHYDASVLDLGDPHQVASSTPLTDRVLAGLDRTPPARPCFLWVHYFDPHYAYLEHAEWKHLGDRDADRYDGEVAHTDREIGRLLDGLDARGRLEGAVVVVTADHGEEFGERGGRLHETLHEEVLRIPLLVRAPNVEPGPRSGTARLLDVAPTILGRVGIAAPSDWPGRDLLADPPAPDEPQFLARDVPSRFRQRGVRIGRDKLIVLEAGMPNPLDAAMPLHPALAPGVYRYDLATDPAETRNLHVPGDPVSAALLARIREHFADPALGDDAN